MHGLVKSGGTWFAVLGLTASLSGCGGGETVGQAFGIERRGPDEMSIIKRPPLTLPPDYNLRPPRPGESRSTAEQLAEDSRRTLTGAEPAAVNGRDAETETAAAEPNGREISPDGEATSPNGGPISPNAGAISNVNGEPSEPASNASRQARAVLTGQEEDWQEHHKSPPLLPRDEAVAAVEAETATEADTATEAEVAKAEVDTTSIGQSALLDRTNRVERDLEALTESRAENRVDRSLLNRLITWQPEARDETSPDRVVQIVRREQTPIDQPSASE